MAPPDAVIDWLLDSDPAIRWQVMRDLQGAPDEQWRAERSRVETQGWGARLLAAQDADGQWAGGAFCPRDMAFSDFATQGQPWTATSFTLTQLREFGIDPRSERLRRTVDLVARNCRWEHDGQPFWEGEVEECINGRLVADGAYFGVDVESVVARLLSERQADGGWNCERANGSSRSSYDTTINVLEGLWQFEKANGATSGLLEARRSGEEFLLERHLYRRLSTGAPADEQYLQMCYPYRWHYGVLRGLDYFRSVGRATSTRPDSRLRAAIDHLRSLQRPDGTFALDRAWRGRVWFEMDDGPGEPSRWVTLKAASVLCWWDESTPQ